MSNAYLDALRGLQKNSKIDIAKKRTPIQSPPEIKLIVSPRRKIVEDQKNRCFVCNKSLNDVLCHFTAISGPELRAVCPKCYFGLDKK